MKLIVVLFLGLTLPGCMWFANKLSSPDKKVELYRENESDTDFLRIYKITHRNCGCATVYAEKFKDGNLAYSLSYACPTGLLPYLQIKEYDISHNVTSKVCYRATDGGNYDTPLTSDDRYVIHLLDSLSQVDKSQNKDYQLCTKSVIGFTKIDCAY